MKRGLVLSGGGRKGAFQVGVLDVLTSRGLDWQFMAGTSVGAINVSFLAQAPMKNGAMRAHLLDLIRLWKDMDTHDVWKNWGIFGPMAGAWRSSFVNSSPLQKMLRETLDDKSIQESGRQVRYGIVNYGTGQYFEATEDSTPQWRYVAASSSYPGGLNPVELPEGTLCGDGGAVSATPLKAAFDAGCDVIDVVLTAPLEANKMDTKDNWLGTRVSAITISMRCVELLSHAAMVEDVKRALLVNKLVSEGADKKHRRVELNVYRPGKYLTTGPLGALDFDPQYSRELIEYGRKCA